MTWAKKRRSYVPDGSRWWAKKYALTPTPHFVDDEVIRIYVAFWDKNTVGRFGFVDLPAADNPPKS